MLGALATALIAIGVVVVGELFGVVGLIVAVPIIAMIAILTEELWVKEIEAGDDARRAATLEVAVAPGAYPPEEADEPASRLS